MDTLYKNFDSPLIVDKDVNSEERTIEHYITTRDIDRTNEIIVPELVDTVNYRNNPVVLFSHIYENPIGKNLWTKLDDSRRGIIAKTKFATTPLANEIFSLYQDGFLQAWSVGYVPMEQGSVNDNGVYVYGKIDLLEYSAVSVPANPAAINLSFVKSLKSDTLKSHFTNEYLLTAFEEEISSLKSSLQSAQDIKQTFEDYKKEMNDKFESILSEVSNLKTIQIKDELQKFINKTIKNKIGQN